jgi:integrase
MAVVEAMTIDSGEYIFRGGRPGKPLSNMAMAAVLKRMGRDDVTSHGFRSSFRDWAGETTGYPREVIEHALAHQLRDKAEAAYARGDLFTKRTLLMRDWTKFVTGAAGTVVTIPTAARTTAAA